jgi:hypothetical protein
MNNITFIGIVILISLLIFSCIVIAGVITIIHCQIKIYFIKKRVKEIQNKWVNEFVKSIKEFNISHKELCNTILNYRINASRSTTRK